MGLAAALDAMSPLKVLTRGYTMAHTGDGKLLKSVTQVSVGDPFLLRMEDGTIHATVDQIDLTADCRNEEETP